MSRNFNVLTKADEQYLEGRNISRYELFWFDMALNIATKEGYVKLSSLKDRFSLYFRKEQIQLLRTLAKRHGIRFWNYIDYGMEKT